MERVKGIEPSQPAWKAGALPLSYTRILKNHLYQHNLSGKFGDNWSGWRDSNSRPSPWQGDALPLSHIRISLYSIKFSHYKVYFKKNFKWRLGWDSNPRPPPWQGGILTSWTTEPNNFIISTFFGADDRTWTYNLLITNQLLYQLSYISLLDF